MPKYGRCKRTNRSVVYNLANHIAVTLKHTHYRNFINECSALAFLCFLICVTILILTTNESFI